MLPTDPGRLASLLDAEASMYKAMEPAGRRPRLPRLGCLLLALASVVVAAVSVGGMRALASGVVVFKSKKSSAMPHTGDWCEGSGAKTYSKTTLKRIIDRPVAGMLEYSAIVGRKKFEASDIIRLGDKFFSVCDSDWSILELTDSLPLLSPANRLIGPDLSFVPPAEDSGFEAVVHDATSGTASELGDFYIVRESVQHEVTGEYAAQVLQVNLHGPAYHVVETCGSEFKFEGDSKGFEGAVSLRGADGVLYLLGLCEGNYCSEAHGKEAGNGRVVVMRREDDESEGCLWKTVRVLSLPPSVAFVDYSAFAVHHSTQAVAVTSQENSQLWIGSLSGGSDGEFDPATAEFSEGSVYDFPRTTGGCAVQYCNIEGIHWVMGGKEEGAPQMLVAASDKMKSKGKQSATCQEKDQSVHLFALP